jgi:hypothetical protein
MSEINLLQGNARGSSGTAVRVSLNVVGGIVLIAACATGGYFYLKGKTVQADDSGVVAQQLATQQAVTSGKDYKNFIATQKSLSTLTTLFAGHLGWTPLLPKFSAATLKVASFSNFAATADGGVDVAGTVPTFADLDKMMQGFQLQDFSSYVQSVSLVNIGMSHSSAGNSVSFAVHVQVKPNIVQYKNQ